MNFKFEDTKKDKLSEIPIRDEQLIICYDTGEIFYDKKGNRVPCCIIPIDKTIDINSDNAISNRGITNSVINELKQVAFITKENIPCGTLAVKELLDRIIKLEEMIGDKT